MNHNTARSAIKEFKFGFNLFTICDERNLDPVEFFEVLVASKAIKTNNEPLFFEREKALFEKRKRRHAATISHRSAMGTSGATTAET